MNLIDTLNAIIEDDASSENEKLMAQKAIDSMLRVATCVERIKVTQKDIETMSMFTDSLNCTLVKETKGDDTFAIITGSNRSVKRVLAMSAIADQHGISAAKQVFEKVLEKLNTSNDYDIINISNDTTRTLRVRSAKTSGTSISEEKAESIAKFVLER